MRISIAILAALWAETLATPLPLGEIWHPEGISRKLEKSPSMHKANLPDEGRMNMGLLNGTGLDKRDMPNLNLTRKVIMKAQLQERGIVEIQVTKYNTTHTNVKNEGARDGRAQKPNGNRFNKSVKSFDVNISIGRMNPFRIFINRDDSNSNKDNKPVKNDTKDGENDVKKPKAKTENAEKGAEEDSADVKNETKRSTDYNTRKAKRHFESHEEASLFRSMILDHERAANLTHTAEHHQHTDNEVSSEDFTKFTERVEASDNHKARLL